MGRKLAWMTGEAIKSGEVMVGGEGFQLFPLWVMTAGSWRRLLLCIIWEGENCMRWCHLTPASCIRSRFSFGHRWKVWQGTAACQLNAWVNVTHPAQHGTVGPVLLIIIHSIASQASPKRLCHVTRWHFSSPLLWKSISFLAKERKLCRWWKTYFV